MNIRKIFLVATAISLMTISINAQASADTYRVYTSTGEPASISQIINQIGEYDVVFLGENHDDSVGHALQTELFGGAVKKYGSQRKVKLSLEMFERDVQIVVDEYLNDHITEKKFLSDSRPWGNYKTDYRPMVELAKEKNLPVIAANPPRRYVNMVSRMGRGSLDSLSDQAKTYLPPLPYPKASKAYGEKFRSLMGASPEAMMGLENILDSQTLWDAGMADSIAKHLEEKSLIVHLNGSFHTESRLGTVEQLLGYKPSTKILVVTLRYDADFKNFDPAKHKGLGDFVVLTDASQPRSKR